MAKKSESWTDDRGKKHPTKKDAEHADAVYAASEGFDDARRAVVKALLAGAKTGDGVPFDAMHSNFYYHVRGGYFNAPSVGQLWIWPHDAEVDMQAGKVRMRLYDTDKRHCDMIEIDSLYSGEKAARKAWVERYEKYIAQCQEELAGGIERAIGK